MLNPSPVEVVTPTGAIFKGEEISTSNIVAVSIIRAGDSLLGRRYLMFCKDPVIINCICREFHEQCPRCSSWKDFDSKR